MTRLVAILLLLIAGASFAAPRSAAERLAFKREHPCPSTGLRRGACPGFVIDHIRPLCAGGPDHRSNLAWSYIDEARAKDAEEFRLCRKIRRLEIPREASTADLCRALSPSQWPHLTKALCAGTLRADENN